MMSRVHLLLCFLLILLILGCGDDVSGTGSQAGNGIVAGTVIDSTGVPLSGAEVYLRSSDYLVDTVEAVYSADVADAVTDNNGSFSISGVSDGDYTLEFLGRDSTALAHRFQAKGDYNHIGAFSLRPPGGFKGNVDITNIADSIEIFVRIYGMHLIAKVDSLGEFFFPHIPPGKHILHIVSSEPIHGIIDTDTIDVKPGEQQGGVFQFPFDGENDTAVVMHILDTNGLAPELLDDIVITDNERITELHLDNLNLTFIPPNIGEIRLDRLVISNNDKIYTLPKELGFIYSLKVLTLNSNSLTHIPGTIIGLRELDTLDLSGNELEGLPYDFEKMKDLQSINVDNNRFKAMSPKLEEWIDARSVNPNWRDTQRP